MKALGGSGWLPVPRDGLPFRSIVAASRNDPLARYERVSALAQAWGSRLAEVGHLNPASGFGDWPQADVFINELNATGVDCVPGQYREIAPSCLPRAC